jgi:hypothetical protein
MHVFRALQGPCGRLLVGWHLLKTLQSFPASILTDILIRSTGNRQLIQNILDLLLLAPVDSSLSKMAVN